MKQNTQAVHSMNHDTESRKHWMGTLARAKTDQLRHAFTTCNLEPEFEYLRPPEVGMIMVRGRTGGKGEQFNLGEMTMTRCSIKTNDGFVGHAYIAGRDKIHAKLAALFDALLQSPEHRPVLLQRVIEPLCQQQEEKQREQAAKTAATKVSFFTMIRGED